MTQLQKFRGKIVSTGKYRQNFAPGKNTKGITSLDKVDQRDNYDTGNDESWIRFLIEEEPGGVFLEEGRQLVKNNLTKGHKIQLKL